MLWGIGVLAVFVHSLVDYPLQRPALAGFSLSFLQLWNPLKKILTLYSIRIVIHLSPSDITWVPFVRT